MLREASPTLVTLERLFPRVMADVADQRALLPKAPAAVLTHVRLVLQMRTEVNLLGVLGFVPFATLWTGVRSLIRMHPSMPLDVCNSLVELATLSTAETPFVDVHLLMLF